MEITQSEQQIERQMKAQRVLNKMNLNRLTPRHIIIKMEKAKEKERILKAARLKKKV